MASAAQGVVSEHLVFVQSHVAASKKSLISWLCAQTADQVESRTGQVMCNFSNTVAEVPCGAEQQRQTDQSSLFWPMAPKPKLKPKLVAQFQTDEHSLQANGVLDPHASLFIHFFKKTNGRER
jgi:hypothetical protein